MADRPDAGIGLTQDESILHSAAPAPFRRGAPSALFRLLISLPLLVAGLAAYAVGVLAGLVTAFFRAGVRLAA